MKLLLFTTFVATICYVSAGKTQRLLAALNGGLMAGVNGGLANRVNPALMAGGLNLPLVAGGGAGLIGQPQFAQFVPGIPAFAVPGPVPNVYPVPVGNAVPYVGVPQMAPVNPPQQPLMGVPGGVMPPQQLPLQPDPLRRFRRQIMKQGNTIKTTVDTQIPAPTDTITTTVCDEDDHHEDN
ncbi:secretory calcium-binding phosphoprotein 9 [Toxotes jaculatrix]|uniref:secretory calcium-binding phosphoprotein 9 n=1 Tax=Toxotes jaculatrix TaxID=941984 RepID=UPI001B3B16BC|nr:secretory calcium-binding phosphoprotein 9 [Toxotes jaculatrix]